MTKPQLEELVIALTHSNTKLREQVKNLKNRVIDLPCDKIITACKIGDDKRSFTLTYENAPRG